MSPSNKTFVSGRFQRSIRIDLDCYEPKAIEGYHCPASSSNILLQMSNHISETGQSAFTWTGPYGSGKSSLVVFLCSLLGKNAEMLKHALASLDEKTAKSLQNRFGKTSWNVIPVVGRRENPARVIGEALEALGLSDSISRNSWTDSCVLTFISDLISEGSKNNSGTMLIVDEMGKFLEYSADKSTDLYLFQQIAETACRSNGKFILIGILHQSFGEYANKLARATREEWTKIQGRFVDLIFQSSVEEQIHLLSKAIENGRCIERPSKRSRFVASSLRKNSTSHSLNLAKDLEKCWPLHPATACLLGAIAKSHFGQNERSVFSFLNSAEPHGFQEFLLQSRRNNLYEPYRLWDYLKINFESSIYASPNGHRWALAAEAIDRCEALGAKLFELRVLKTIAVLDFLREQSGLIANSSLIDACLTSYSKKSVQNALVKIQGLSLVVYRKFIGGYSIFAGSDFNIESAIEDAREKFTEINFVDLRSISGIQPILAKRHYHETGTMRWFDVAMAPIFNIEKIALTYQLAENAVGLFLIAIPTRNESATTCKQMCKVAGRVKREFDIVVGFSEHSWNIASLYDELLALRRVSKERPELAGDSIARREVKARLSSLIAKLEIELSRTVDGAIWFLKHRKPRKLHQSELSILASELADRKYSKAPKIFNELLNRTKPSSSAVGAQNSLLRRMVVSYGKKRLGIEGNAAESGLFASMLEQTKLYIESDGVWGFNSPEDNQCVDEFQISPFWTAALSYLESENRPVELAEIYKIWRQPPYGVRDGLMPILIVALILSQTNNIAFYREGIFQVKLKELDVEFLAKHPKDVSIRWIIQSRASKELLDKIAEVAKNYNKDLGNHDNSPLNVARGLVSIFERLPEWTVRTSTLSSDATEIRTLLKQAADPHQFLFDDLPNTLSQTLYTSSTTSVDIVISSLRRGLSELIEAYPKMLSRLRDNLLKELRVSKANDQSFLTLRKRAENVRELSGDFRLEAFIGRLAQYRNTFSDIEGLASLAVNKFPNLWVDSDYDRSNLELTALAQNFVRLETLARVKGRLSKRQVMAVILSGDDEPTIHEFHVADTEYETVNQLVARIVRTLDEVPSTEKDTALAALATVSARYFDTTVQTQSLKKIEES